MYDNKILCEQFAQLEENQNYKVASLVFDILMYDKLISQNIGDFTVANLGGGAHVDVFDHTINQLTKSGLSMDRIDSSPYMLSLALEKYLPLVPQYMNSFRFICADVLNYFSQIYIQYNLIISKYVLGGIQDIDAFFHAVAKGLKAGGICYIDMPRDNAYIQSHSINARNFLNGIEIPLGEKRDCSAGDVITMKFLKKSGDPFSGYIDKIEQNRYYYSHQDYIIAARKAGLEADIDDRRGFIKNNYSFGMPPDFCFLIMRCKKI